MLATLLIAATACSDRRATTSDAVVREDLLTDAATMMAWIGDIVAQGIRRPGYAADAWTEEWARERFTELGLADVTLEPVAVRRFEPRGCTLEVWPEDASDELVALPCFPVPFTAPTAGYEAEVRLAGSAEEGDVGDVRGAIAVVENPPLVLPQTFMRSFATWWYDPANEIPTHEQTILFGAPARALLETEMRAGAGAFVGIVRTPWETDRLYAPYDAVQREIPAVWLSASNGDRVLALLHAGRARGRLRVASSVADATSHNVTGVLRAPSDDWVIIGSHHDGPWASAVEDASGVALVLAQARYWSRVPEDERPHNLLFLLNAGHMSGGAGLRSFTSVNEQFIRERVVLELHLEHVAREARAVDGGLVPTDLPEWRWWFTSRIPPLEEIVADAICREDVGRSFVMPPQGFPPGSMRPPTDAARFHPLSPIVSLLSAPMYLFDPADTLEMVHEDSLVPLTRAAVRIVDATRAHTAAGLRARVDEQPRPDALPSCEERTS